MTWEPPEVSPLLELRLARAEETLDGDPRIARTRAEQRYEDADFLHALVVSQMSAAARQGFEAAEATLRASAFDYLSSQPELSTEAVVTLLDQAAGAFALPAPQTEAPRLIGRAVMVLAGLVVFAIVTALMLALCGEPVGTAEGRGAPGEAASNLSHVSSADRCGVRRLPAALCLGALSGGVIGGLLWWMRRQRSRRQASRVAMDLPEELGRFYSDRLTIVVGEYQAAVNRAARLAGVSNDG